MPTCRTRSVPLTNFNWLRPLPERRPSPSGGSNISGAEASRTRVLCITGSTISEIRHSANWPLGLLINCYQQTGSASHFITVICWAATCHSNGSMGYPQKRCWLLFLLRKTAWLKTQNLIPIVDIEKIATDKISAPPTERCPSSTRIPDGSTLHMTPVVTGEEWRYGGKTRTTDLITRPETAQVTKTPRARGRMDDSKCKEMNATLKQSPRPCYLF